MGSPSSARVAPTRTTAAGPASAILSETLEIGIRCEWIGSKSFAFAYEIWEKTSGRTVVEATSVQVCYDYGTKQTLPMPDDLRRRLEAFEGRALGRRS